MGNKDKGRKETKKAPKPKPKLDQTARPDRLTSSPERLFNATPPPEK